MEYVPRKCIAFDFTNPQKPPQLNAEPNLTELYWAVLCLAVLRWSLSLVKRNFLDWL